MSFNQDENEKIRKIIIQKRILERIQEKSVKSLIKKQT